MAVRVAQLKALVQKRDNVLYGTGDSEVSLCT